MNASGIGSSPEEASASFDRVSICLVASGFRIGEGVAFFGEDLGGESLEPFIGLGFIVICRDWAISEVGLI